MYQAESEDQVLHRYESECGHDSNLDRHVHLSDTRFYSLSVGSEKTVQQLLRLLQINLFEKRDMYALLRGDPPAGLPPNHLQFALL